MGCESSTERVALPIGNLSDGDIVELVPKHNNEVRVDVQGASNRRSTKLQLWSANGSNAQRFRVHFRPGGCFSFHPLCAPEKAIDRTGAANKQCHIWDANDNNTNQSFALEPASTPGYFLIIHTASGKCLDVAGARGKGAALLTFDRHGNPNQQFQLLGSTGTLPAPSVALRDLINQRAAGPAATTTAALALLASSDAAALGEAGVGPATTHKQHPSLPQYAEFAECYRDLALDPSWLQQSRLRQFTAAFEHPSIKLETSKRAKVGTDFDYEGSVTCAVIKAYRCTEQQVAQQKDPLTGRVVYGELNGLYGFANKKKALVVAGCILADLGHSDELAALLSQVCDRAFRCQSAKQHGVNALIVAAGNMIEKRLIEQVKEKEEKQERQRHKNKEKQQQKKEQRAGAKAQKNSPQKALVKSSSLSPSSSPVAELEMSFNRIFDIITDFLDDFKMRAFSSAFIEPCRFMYSCAKNTHGVNHVEVHGINWFLVIAEEGLGVGMPISTAEDPHFTAFDDFWASFPNAADEARVWKVFSDSKNFGAHFEGLARQFGSSVPSVKPQNFRPQVPSSSFQRQFKADASTRRRWVKTMQRFSYFFSHQFLVRKMLETLNSELKPEHSGFRKACARLFREFQGRKLDVTLAPQQKQEQQQDQKQQEDQKEEEKNKDASSPPYDDFDSFCYNDEYYIDMNVDRVALFFCWLGVIRPPHSAQGIDPRNGIKWPDVIPKYSDHPPVTLDGTAAPAAESAAGVGGGVGGEVGEGAAETLVSSDQEDQDMMMQPQFSTEFSGTFEHAPDVPIHVAMSVLSAAQQQNLNDDDDDDDDDDDGGDGDAVFAETGFLDTTHQPTDLQQQPKPSGATGAVSGAAAAAASSSSSVPPASLEIRQLDAVSGGDSSKKVNKFKLESPNANKVLDQECPICLDVKTDISVLPHVTTVGDISSHRMCGDCRGRYLEKGECPFCREALVCENFVQVSQQFAVAIAGAGDAKGGDTVNVSAALFEEWELIEMMNPNPRILERIAGLVLKDPRCGGVIAKGVRKRRTFLRDCAAVIFRLHAIVTERLPSGSLQATLSADMVQMLRDAVELILQPFETGHDSAMNLDSHFYGALQPVACRAGDGDELRDAGADAIRARAEDRAGRHPCVRDDKGREAPQGSEKAGEGASHCKLCPAL